MDPGRVVFDISSDEEESGVAEPKGDEDFDWLKDYLGIVEKEQRDHDDDDDSDDEVVVVGEFKPKAKSKSFNPTVRGVDDDCVILDGDPDKPLVDDSVSDSDEVLVVGEKGQIACRDFPHSRHLCATFPFTSTPHEKHCDQCHCYVCDSPAPCVHWATSSSSMDHCHATEKEEAWKIQRRNFKSGNIPPLPASKVSGSPLPMGLPQVNQVSPLNIIRLSPNSRPQNPVSRPSTIQGGSSTNFAVPTIISRSRGQQPASVLAKNRIQQPRIPLLGASQNIRKGNGHLLGNSVPHFAPSHTMLKRPGNVGVSLPRNQSAQFSLNGRNRVGAVQCARAPASGTALNDLNTMRWEDIYSTTHQSSFNQDLVSTALNNLVCTALSTPPSQPQIYSQHLPPSNDSQYIYHHGNQFQNNGQSIYNHGNETQNSSKNIIGSIGVNDASSVDHSSSWVNNANQSNQQPPVEHTQLPSAESFFEPSVKESNSEFSIRNTEFPDFLINDWILENQSLPVAADGSLAPPLDVFSPEPDPIDAGMPLFDFETPWNGVTSS